MDNKPTQSDLSLFKQNVLNLIFSALVGILFSFLFLWKEFGISHLIFTAAALILFSLPLARNPKLWGKVNGSLFTKVVAALLLISAVFLYRLKLEAVVILFVLFPLIYTGLTVYLVHGEKIKRVGVFTFLKALMMMVYLPLADGIKYLGFLWKHRTLSKNFGKDFLRVLTGLLIAFPFVLIFLLLFAQADQVFADLLIDILKNTIGKIFTDFSEFVEFVIKLAIGQLVAIYLAVSNFAIWSDDTYLSKHISFVSDEAFDDWSEKFDTFISTVFLTSLNVIFVLFVYVQFFYLFGGDQNVIGDDAKYTYSEYARKGFVELLMASALVMGIIYVTRFKTKVGTDSTSKLFQINQWILTLCSIVIAASSFYRLWLVESAFGLTGIRLFAHIATTFIIILFVAMLFTYAKQLTQRTLNRVALTLFFTSVAILLLLPTDLMISSVNVARAKESDFIDLPYLISQSDEVIPSMYSLLEHGELSQEYAHVVAYALAERYSSMVDRGVFKGVEGYSCVGAPSWCEKKTQFGGSFTIYRNVIIKNQFENGEVPDKYDFTNNDILTNKNKLAQMVDSDIDNMLREYYQLLKERRYEEAHSAYWSQHTQLNVDVVKDLEKNWSVKSVAIRGAGTINTELFFDDVKSSGSFGRYYKSAFSRHTDLRLTPDVGHVPGGYYIQNYKAADGTYCVSDSVRLVLQSGGWKILDASAIQLGKGQGEYIDGYYEQDNEISDFTSCTGFGR